MVLVSHALKKEKIEKKKFKIVSIFCLTEMATMFEEAQEKLSKLAAKENTWSFFCLARLYAAWRKEKECEEWLMKCQQENFLKKATSWQLLYFENVKDQPWFIQLHKGDKMEE